MKNWIRESVILALGITIGAFLLQIGIDHYVARERIVTVKGLATKEVKANEITWPISYQLMGNSIQELYTKIESLNKTITQFLNSNGIDSNEIAFAAPKIEDTQANYYGNKLPTYRYKISAVITVSSKRVDLVRKIIAKQTELLKKGIPINSGNNYENRIEYKYTKLNEVKPTMIKEATRNARKSAEQFAEDSHSKLGKIRTANQGQFSIYNRDNYTPYIKTIRVVSTIQYYLDN